MWFHHDQFTFRLEPGTTTFAKDFDRHAERLAGFLRDAPGVSLDMKSVLTVADIVALKREAVRRRIDAAALAGFAGTMFTLVEPRPFSGN